MLVNGGSYCLVMKLDEPRAIQVGRLGRGSFPGGYYVYVGSALNGLQPRIARHLSPRKKKYWHIDYLLEYVRAIATRKIISFERMECGQSEKIRDIAQGIPMKGFGSSDCSCIAHLHFFSSNPLSDSRFEAIWTQELPPRPCKDKAMFKA